MTTGLQTELEQAETWFGGGERPRARSLCVEILEREPDCAPAVRLIALDHACNGDHESALAGLGRALALQSDPLWRRDMASVLGFLDRWNEALEQAQQAVCSDPTNADALALLGRCLLNCGEVEKSLEAYGRARESDPASPQILLGLSRALTTACKWDDALTALRECAHSESCGGAAYEAMADIQRRTARFDQEVESRRALVALWPGDPSALARLGLALYETGALDECIDTLREVLRVAPQERYVHSALLCASIHHPDQTPASLIQDHRDFVERHCFAPDATSHVNSPDPDRKLRVGYLTGECMLNPTIFFFLPVLKRHDAARFETYCYHTRPQFDSHAELYRKAASHWRDVSTLSTGAIAAAVREDRIDILVDVSGHFPFGALPVFALRPAPVQVATANYPCTTAMPTMDYILTDQWTCPPGYEAMYTETPVRIPSGYFTWEPQVEEPASAELPASANGGSVTFCMLQRPPKINSGVLDAAAAVLAELPTSTLMIHQGTRDLDNREGLTARSYLREFERRGIPETRIRFEGGMPLDRHLKLISTTDIALDSFPYSGQTTTCECLYMGVPVVTLAGDTHASRVSASILHRAGCGDWVTNSISGYVDKAVTMGRDLAALARIRTSLRSLFCNSALCDSETITREIELAFRAMWVTHCERRACQGQT